MREKIIQVLWVENDPMITQAYPREADMREGIEIVPFSCWEEAEEALEEDYSRWDAILLDAKCSYRRGDADKATRFLTNVFRRIEALAKTKKHTIPWYVLSGQGEDDIHDLIPVDIDWDTDWARISNRRFYSKNGTVTIGNEEMLERHALYRRIKNQVIHNNPKLQIEYDEYPDVFASLTRLESNGLDVQAGGFLVNLLEPIHFPTTTPYDYNRRYMDLRKFLELIFRHMVARAILPSIMRNVSKTKDEINLSWSSKFLGEKFQTYDEIWKHVTRDTDENKPLLPKQLGDAIKEAVFQAGGAVHTSQAEAEINMNLDKYLPTVGYSPYMLRSLALSMCDLVLWYDYYYQSHCDKEENEKLWTILD